MPESSPTRYPFSFAASYRLPALLLGITPGTSWVDLDHDVIVVRFGPWRLRTPLSNIEQVQRTGRFAWWKSAGPPHLSFADRGVTFATNSAPAGAAALCLTFREPVPALDPTGHLRHPGATLTVAEPERLARDLAEAGVAT